MKKATGDWVLFLGDDDRITEDYVAILVYNLEKHSKLNPVAIATFMTVFDNEKDECIKRTPTGMIKREYLLKHPFNEKLEKGIDREWFERMAHRGDKQVVIPYHFGYYYRQHEDYSCAAPVHMLAEQRDIYMVAISPVFIDPIADRLIEKGNSVYVETGGFQPEYAKKAKVIWSDWGNADALRIADFKCDAKKILRIHAFEVFFQIIHHINFDAFDKIVFVADHIKEYLEKKYDRKLENAVVIPNGVDLNKWTLPLNKKKNNKIVMAGNIAEGKGSQLLLFIARHFPEYEFHVCGKFAQEDVYEYFMEKKTDNVFLYTYQYDLNDFFKDKTYVISPSIRESQHMTVMEGMAAGLKPLLFDWIGAKKIYKPEWVWNDLKSLESILSGDYKPREYREFIEKNYNFEDKYKEIEALIVDSN
ncbi:MAG: glycosyltransferase [Alphaproteobacteria bacterium]|nr:glycosyltransferase [Alphaproteobacteria bacterium]